MIGNKSKENNLKSIEKKNEDDQSDANEDLDNELKDALFSEKKLEKKYFFLLKIIHLKIV